MKNYKMLIVIFISLIILYCSSSPIESIEPVKINLENKQKLLLLSFDELTENIFQESETYDYLSDYLTDKMNNWLTKTNGFNVTNLSQAEPEPEFDINYAYISNNSIFRALKAYAQLYDYDLIIYPTYNMNTTTESTGTNQILSLEIKIFSYDVNNEEVNYTNSQNSLIGIDTSLYEGETSLIDNSNQNIKNEEEILENEKNIADKTKIAFDIIISNIINDYALFIQDELNQSDSPNDDQTNDNNDQTDNSNNNNEQSENNSSN
jgi:hypothetical protein